MNNTPLIPHFRRAVVGLQYVFLILLAVLFIIKLNASLYWRLIADSAFLHYVAYLINEHGFIPYRDIFEVNMPGTYLFHMAIGKLFGYSDFAFRMVDATWLLATLTVTWFIMQPIGRVVATASCLLFGLVYFDGGPHFSLQRDAIAILPVACSLLLTIHRKPNQSVNLVHFLIGVLFALAALIKPHMAIGLPAIIVFNCVHSTDNSKSIKSLFKHCLVGIGYAFIGFLLTLIIPFIWLWRIGALQPFWDIFSSYTPLYLQMSGDLKFRGDFSRLIFLFLKYTKFGDYEVLLTASMFGVYFIFAKSASAKVKQLAILLLTLSLLYSVYVIFGNKGWRYHWIPFSYFTSLGAALTLYSSPSESPPRPHILPLMVFIVAALTMSIPTHYRAVQIKRQLSQHTHPVYPKTKTADEIAAYLDEHLLPNDRVQPLEWISGGVHAMLISKAVIATPYLTNFQFYHNVSTPYIQNLRQDFITKLYENKPEFIVEVHKTSIVHGLDTTKEFPELRKFIEQYYQKDYIGNGFDIFRLNNS